MTSNGNAPEDVTDSINNLNIDDQGLYSKKIMFPVLCPKYDYRPPVINLSNPKQSFTRKGC